MQNANDWERALHRLQNVVTKDSFKRWFNPTFLIRSDPDLLVIRVPNPVYKMILTGAYGTQIKNVFTTIGRPNVTVRYIPDTPVIPPFPYHV